MTGDTGEIGTTGGTCQAGTTSLADGQSCTVEVAFEPTTVGSKNATLQIATNDGEFTAGLSGTGTEAPDPGPGPGPTPEPSFTALKLTSKVKRVRAPRKGRKTTQARVRVTNSGDAAGTATVTLRSSSRKVRVPGQVRIQVGPGSSKARSFKVTIRPGAPRKVKLTARSGGGGGGKATFSEITITVIKPPKK